MLIGDRTRAALEGVIEESEQSGKETRPRDKPREGEAPQGSKEEQVLILNHTSTCSSTYSK